jgi:hemerythrin-like domain-containing protein
LRPGGDVVSVLLNMKITEALGAEHTIFLRVFDQIERVLPSLTSSTEVQTVAGIIEGMLGTHADAEANLAYLALDHVLHEKGKLDRMHQDHHEIDNRLKQAKSARTCAEGRRLLQSALASSREHFRLEERILFPVLESALLSETLEKLGSAWAQRLALEVAAADR